MDDHLVRMDHSHATFTEFYKTGKKTFFTELYKTGKGKLSSMSLVIDLRHE